SYSVTVTGTSGTLVHTATIAVTVTTAGPTARFSYSPTVPKVNDTVLFDASSSSDTNSAATLQARWDWEGDGTWDTSFSSTLTAQHAFPMPGTYLVKLEIQDSSGFSAMQSQGVLVLDLQGTGGGAPPGYGLTDPATLQARGPIAITSNGGFSAANGVRSGTGTSMDPYIISDWFIDGNSYSSGTFHTGGIHLGDTYVDDASRATGVIATRNTVVNATAGGIVTASAVDTVIAGNLVSMDYPGRKIVSADAPHGTATTEKS